MHLQMLSSAAVLKPGDQLATSASVKDRPYVPGVPIGVITKLINVNGALTEAALVRPYVDYTGCALSGSSSCRPGTTRASRRCHRCRTQGLRSPLR